MLETFTFLANTAPQWLALFGGLSLAGFIPRVGPGRALWVAIRSRFSSPRILSNRGPEVEDVRFFLSNSIWDQEYMVVIGDKGVGKSCLVSTALSNTAGVIKTSVNAGDSSSKVIECSLRALTNIQLAFWSLDASARRVIFFYRLLTLGSTPIVRLNVLERRPGQESAALVNAVRYLREDLGLRVIVDGSPNSIEGSLLSSKRQHVVSVLPMDRTMLWTLPQLQQLFRLLKEAELEDVAWALLGGVPQFYVQLWSDVVRVLKINNSATYKKDEELLGDLLCGIVYAKANELIKDKNIKQLIALYKEDAPKCGGIHGASLETRNLNRPEPDKIFRTIWVDGGPVLVPATNLVRVALHHDLARPPTVEELRIWAKAEKEK